MPLLFSVPSGSVMMGSVGVVVGAVVGAVVGMVVGWVVAAVVAMVVGMVPSASPFLLRQPVRPVTHMTNARARMVYFFIVLPPKFFVFSHIISRVWAIRQETISKTESSKKLSIITEQY